MRTKLAIASLAAIFTLIMAPMSALAGYAPASRPTFTCITPTNCPGASYVTFNSFTNAPNYGDERAFFDAKDASITTSGGYQDSLTVRDGQRLVMRVYVHNNANPAAIGEAAATAINPRLQVLFGEAKITSRQVFAQITADNSNPATVSDSVDLSGPRPFRIAFDRSAPVQVTYRPGGTGAYVTQTLPGASFASDYTLNANLPNWKGCFEYSALITFTSVIRMDAPIAPTPTPKTPIVVATKTTTLPNTGPGGSALAIFGGVSALAGVGHYFYRTRRSL